MEHNMDLDGIMGDANNLNNPQEKKEQTNEVTMDQDDAVSSGVAPDTTESDNLKHMEEMDKNLKYWQDKYSRLLEAHRKLQSINQSLEDKLLNLADSSGNDRKQSTLIVQNLERTLENTKRKLEEVERLNEMNEKNCLVAVQLLQCKQADFITHKLSSIPADLQEKLKHLKINNNTAQIEKSPRSSSPACDNSQYNLSRPMRVPIPTFPPMATMYTADRKQDKTDFSNEDTVTAPLMGKVLEERIHELNAKQYHMCDYCHINHASKTLTPKTTQTYTISTDVTVTSQQKQQQLVDSSKGALVKSDQINVMQPNSEHSIQTTQQHLSTDPWNDESWSNGCLIPNKVINI